MVRCNQEQRGNTSTRTTGTENASTQQNWQYSNSESDTLHGHAVVVHIVCTQYCVYWQDANTTVCIATRVVTCANPAFKPPRTHHHTIHHPHSLRQSFPALSSRIRKAENRVLRVLLNSTILQRSHFFVLHCLHAAKLLHHAEFYRQYTCARIICAEKLRV